MEVKIVKHSDYLEVQTNGRFSLEENKASFDSLLTLCEQEKCYHLLVDMRSVEGVCLKFECYDFINHITPKINSFLAKKSNDLRIFYCASSNLIQDESYMNEILIHKNIPFSAGTDYEKALLYLNQEVKV